MAYGKLALVIIAVAIATLAQLEVDEDPLVVERHVTIPRTKSEVFDYVANIEKMTEWFPGVTVEDPIDNSKLGVGKLYYEYLSLPVIGVTKVTLEITKYKPRKHIIGYETDLDMIMPRYEIKCEEKADDAGKLKTRVIWKMYTRKRSYLYYGTVLQVMRVIMKDRAASALLQLFYKFAS